MLTYFYCRYLRLTPVIVNCMILYLTLFNHLTSGPFWSQNIKLKEACEKNWWLTLLYIQNFWDVKDICVSQTWFLAVDTQLYVLAPLIFFPIQKWPATTVFGMIILIAMSCFGGFYVSWNDHVNANLLS